MFGGFRQYLIFILALATVLALLPCAVLADVNLEWRSDLPQVVVGDVVDVNGLTLEVEIVEHTQVAWAIAIPPIAPGSDAPGSAAGPEEGR